MLNFRHDKHDFLETKSRILLYWDFALWKSRLQEKTSINFLTIELSNIFLGM